MGCAERLKLTMLAPAGLGVIALVLGLISIFSPEWTSAKFTYRPKGNATLANHTIAEIKLSASLGVSKYCYTMDVQYEISPGKLLNNRSSSCSDFMRCPFKASRYCLGSDGAYFGLVISIPFTVVAILVTLVRRCFPHSDGIYGLSCFFYFGGAVFAAMSAALWATAFNTASPTLLRPLLPAYASDHASRSNGVTLGHPFALTIVAAMVAFLGMYLSAYHHVPTPSLYAYEPLTTNEPECNIELSPTAAGLMRRATHRPAAGDM